MKIFKNRVIPCLLLQNNGLVKTTRFKKPVYVGDPINAIKIFNDKEVDELILLDIDASKTSKEPDYKFIREIAGECFMPLCYGGGIKNLQQAYTLFSLGVEKLSLQTQLYSSLDLLSQISTDFGRQSVVVSVDIKKNLFGKYEIFSAAQNKTLKLNWIKFLELAMEAGAGEILINSVDRDGTMSGVDAGLIKEAAAVCNVPLIVMGGVGKIEDIKLAIDSGADAVAAGAYFVFHGPHRAVLITYPKYKDLLNLFQ